MVHGRPFYIKKPHVTVLVSEPRILIVRVCNQCVDIILISAHGPQSTDKSIDQWWEMLETTMHNFVTSRTMLIAGVDANLHIPAMNTVEFGDAGPPRGGRKYGLLVNLARTFAAYLPNTFSCRMITPENYAAFFGKSASVPTRDDYIMLSNVFFLLRRAFTCLKTLMTRIQMC